MQDNIKKAQDIFLEKLSRLCEKFGINNITAQLYVILYFSNKPLSLDDMVEELQISKGSASVNIRVLERYGAVRRVWIKGSRKDYYEAEPDISKVITERMQSMVNGRLTEIEDMLDSSRKSLNSIDIKDQNEQEYSVFFKEKLEKIIILYEQAKAMFELFNSTVLTKSSILDTEKLKVE